MSWTLKVPDHLAQMVSQAESGRLILSIEQIKELAYWETEELERAVQEIHKLQSLLAHCLTYIQWGTQKIDAYALTLGIEDVLGLEERYE